MDTEESMDKQSERNLAAEDATAPHEREAHEQVHQLNRGPN
jgi:hypothetical protein